MFDRSSPALLVAAALASAALCVAAPASADPQCPAAGCPHGPANTPSYKDGYKTEHDYFSSPQNHAYLASEMTQGYNSGMVCQVEVGGGAAPANLTDWLSGCVDALHDLGFRP